MQAGYGSELQLFLIELSVGKGSVKQADRQVQGDVWQVEVVGHLWGEQIFYLVWEYQSYLNKPINEPSALAGRDTGTMKPVNLQPCLKIETGWASPRRLLVSITSYIPGLDQAPEGRVVIVQSPPWFLTLFFKPQPHFPPLVTTSSTIHNKVFSFHLWFFLQNESFLSVASIPAQMWL